VQSILFLTNDLFFALGIAAGLIVLLLIASFILWWKRHEEELNSEKAEIQKKLSSFASQLRLVADLLEKEYSFFPERARNFTEEDSTLCLQKDLSLANVDPSLVFSFELRIQAWDKELVLLEAQFPELKDNSDFNSVLEKKSNQKSEAVEMYRRYFANVTMYNHSISSFPTVLIAKRLKLSPYQVSNVC